MKTRNFKITNFAVDNLKTIYFFTVIIIIAGIMAYRSTPKEMMPEVVFPFFSITTVYPGTSPTDMENLVTRPIEKQLKSVKGVKEISSSSMQDFSMIFVEFETNVDQNESSVEVKDAVDKAKSDLPSNLPADPVVTKIEISEFPIVNINLSGDLGLVKLKENAEELQDLIEGLEEVTRVDIIGALDREIQINIDLYKMQAAGISFMQIENAVMMENMTISSGYIRMDGMRRNMRIVGEFSSVDEIASISLKQGVFLKDIAEVTDSYSDRESYARLNGSDVVTLNVIKKGGANLIYAVDKVKDIVANYQESAPENLIVTITGDNSVWTRNSVKDLFNTIILGFMVVVLVLMFFMGVDNALFVAIAIPLSMLIAFIIIPTIGFTMNMVVLVAFILVLGIVVDNSIVVVENIYRHFMTTPDLPIVPATKLAVGEVAIPVITGTLTTMAPFAPLLFWPGIMGEFMSYIPATIILTLLASMFVAFVMNPVFAVSFMKYREGKEGTKLPGYKILLATSIVLAVAVIFYITGTYLIANLLTFGVFLFLFTKYIVSPLIKKFQKNVLPVFSKAYSNTLEFLLKGKRPYLVLASTIFLFIFTFFLLGIRTPKIVLFPQGDPSNIYVYLRMPSGTDIEVTDSVTKVLEVRVFEVLGGKNNPDVESVISNVAIGAGQDFFERSTQSKLGKITVSFVEYKYRVGQPTGLYVNQLREELAGIPGAEIVVDVDQMGPPTGKPISIEISGAEIAELIHITEKMRLFIDSLQIAGIEELKSDMEVNSPELYIEIDREKANKLGLNTAMIGMTMRTALFGKDISKFREGEDEFDIRIRLKEDYRKDLNTLMNMIITAPGGGGPNGGPKEIPLSAVATANYTTSYGGIIRKDNNRMITLSSNILDGYNANEIVGQLRKEMAGFQLPEGYSVKFAGEQDDQNEAADFLVWALFAAVGLIFIVLVTQFNSISKPIIILVQVLFSIIGVLLGLVIFNLDISVIMTGMGIIAVAGIVVKNAIILFDYADLLIEKGTPMREALIEAGRTRLIPVILTATSTILGLLPLAIGMNIDFAGLFAEFNPQIYFGGPNASFWKPLAWSIIFGLSFATFLTLVVVPSMYLMVSRAKTGVMNMANKISGNGN
jgi:multidrug efflux pump